MKFPFIRASGKTDVPKILSFNAKLDIQAKDDEKSGLPMFEMVANTGTPMDLEGFFDPVILEISGSKFDRDVTPVIGDHDTSRRIGHTIIQKIVPAGKRGKFRGKMIDGPVIAAAGVVSSKMGIATGFVEDAKAGFPFQVSVGATIEDAYYLEKGEKAKVNGKQVVGPMIVVTNSLIRELTICVLGADKDTKVSLAAKKLEQSKGNLMPKSFLIWLEAQGFKKEDLNEAQLQAMLNTYNQVKATRLPAKKTPEKASEGGDLGEVDDPIASVKAKISEANKMVAANTERVMKIKAAFAKFNDLEKVTLGEKEIPYTEFQAHAIENMDMTVDAVELTLLKASMSSVPAPAIHSAIPASDIGVRAISAALCRQQGMVRSKVNTGSGEKWGWEHFFDDKTLEASYHKDLQSLSLHQLMDMTIHAAGMSYHGNRKSDDFRRKCQEALMKIKASGSGRSTMTLVDVFEDSSNKFLLAGYESQNTTWQEIVRIRPVSDFKVHNMYRLVSKGAYHQIGIDGQLEHGTWDEQKYTLQADTYGKIVGLDRRHIINDDLDVFATIMTSLGVESARAIEESVYLLLLSSLTALFPTDNSNGNYIAGAATALSIDALSTAQTIFENQVDADNAPILHSPDRILCGTALRVPSGRLFSEARTTPTGGANAEDRFTDNPHVGAYRPVVSPYMNNTKIKQRVDVKNLGEAIPGQSNTHWILMTNPSSPSGALLYLALLNGNRVPIIESADSQFDMLGMQWRAYHDFGTGLGDHVFGLYSKGAG